MSIWSHILFNLAVLINLIVAFFYPFSNVLPGTWNRCAASRPIYVSSDSNLLVVGRSRRSRVRTDMGRDAAVGRTGDCRTETSRNTSVRHVRHRSFDLFGGTGAHVGSPRHHDGNVHRFAWLID